MLSYLSYRGLGVLFFWKRTTLNYFSWKLLLESTTRYYTELAIPMIIGSTKLERYFLKILQIYLGNILCDNSNSKLHSSSVKDHNQSS